MSDYTVFGDVRCAVGEGPLWHQGEHALYWVDIPGHTLYRLRLGERQPDRWDMGEAIGFVAITQSGALVVGLRSGFARVALDPLAITPIFAPEPDRPGSRLNDGKVDQFGRLWAGSMALDGWAGTGTLYRLDPEAGCQAMDGGFGVPNGPAFSPDGRWMYHADTMRGVVHRYALSLAGDPSGRSDFIRFPSEWGLPDGLTVDAEGGLWIGHWNGGRLSRFDPEGHLVRSVPLPASRITSCAFGGADLDRLFVTSAAFERGDEPLAGAVFEIDPGVRGLAPSEYRG